MSKPGDWLRFIREALRHPRQIGAVAPSSDAYCRSMAALIPPTARAIVELGAGTGVLTRAILDAMPQARVVAIELDPTFCALLRTRFAGEKRLTVAEGSAARLRELLARAGVGTPDAVLSCLPFKSLPGDTTERILTECRETMGPRSVFLALQYTKALTATFEKYLRIVAWHRFWRNVPPSYTLEARSKKATD